MSWRIVVVTKPSKLDYSLGYFVMRSVEDTVKVHISEISMLIIENAATSITSVLLNELNDKKVKVIFCDSKRNPSMELTAYYGSHDCSLKLKNQLSWSELARQHIWTEIVTQKIRGQALVLKHYDLQQAQMLFDYIDEIEFNDASNREGHAAKVYFNALFGKTFTRSDDENPINSALNYGYSLILSCFNREIVSSGYLTQLGLFHDNMFNQYNLSCDLMEPFRPFVDFKVREMEPKEFAKEEKYSIISLLNDDVVIDERSNTMLNAIKIYSKSVFKAIEENDVSHIRFARNEL